MKSLLVDALRQKDEGQEGEGLSDSGSFATPRADLAANVADEASASEAASDLELMATGAFIVANDEELQKLDSADGEEVDGTTDVEFSETIAGETTRLIMGEAVVPARDSLPSMPPVARHAPLVCIALALLAAITWLGIQQLELQQERSQLGSSTAALRAEVAVDENGIAATAPRFRYLGLDGQPLDEEAWQ